MVDSQAIGTREDLDMYAKEVELIAGMLETMKKELEEKESLLSAAEEDLLDTERQLEKRGNELIEKNELLEKRERELAEKKEQMRRQQEELHLHAAIEYLSFQTRENELQTKIEVEQKKIGEAFGKLNERAKEIKTKMGDLKRAKQVVVPAGEAVEAVEAEEAVAEAKAGGEVALSMVDVKAMQKELLSREGSLNDLQAQLMELETELQAKEETLQAKEEELGSTVESLDQKKQQLADREAELENRTAELAKAMEKGPLTPEEVSEASEMEAADGTAVVSPAAVPDDYEILKRKVKEYEEREAAMNDLREHLMQMEARLRDREDELQFREEMLREGTLGEEYERAEAEETAKLMEELEERQQELDTQAEQLNELREHLIGMESRLREREDEIQQRLEALDQSAGAPAIDEVRKRERQLKESEYKLEQKSSENELLKNAMEELKDELEEREEHLDARERELESKRKELLEEAEEKGAITDEDMERFEVSEEEVKFRVEHEMRKRMREMRSDFEERAQDRIKPLLEKIGMLQDRNEELENVEDRMMRQELELKAKEEELRRRNEEMAYYEQRMRKREERLLQEKLHMDEELRKLRERGVSAASSVDERVRVKNEQLKELEEKLRKREEFLQRKEMEMQRKEDRLIEEELNIEVAVAKEAKESKVKSGVRRIDDLLYGGLPPQSNLLVYGPPFTGRQLFLNLFIIEGIKKGIPGIFILTDKCADDVRKEVKQILPKYTGYENQGLIKYVDAYSKLAGVESEDEHSIYLSDITDHDAILDAVDEALDEFAEAAYVKVAMHSMSTILINSDQRKSFKFLQGLTNKLKRSQATSFYTLNYGMHGESEVQVIKAVMSGVIEFKSDDVKSYLRVEGIGEARSRSWIEYEHTSKNIIIRGSFAVDHIR